MWIITALLVLVGWTGIGFVAALLFFRMGFGFEARRDAAERMPQAPEPDIQRHRAADPGYALTPVDYSRRRRGWRPPPQGRADANQTVEPRADARSSEPNEPTRRRLRATG